MHISSKCSIAIHCLIYIHEHSHNTKVTSELLSLSTGCNPVTIRNILSALKKDGILSVRFGTGGATICCPLEEINLYRICMDVDPQAIEKFMGIHPAPSSQCPVGACIKPVLQNTYLSLQENLRESMKAIPLQRFIDAYHTQLQTTE